MSYLSTAEDPTCPSTKVAYADLQRHLSLAILAQPVVRSLTAQMLEPYHLELDNNDNR